MSLSLRSQNIIDQLLAGKTVTADKTSIGPLTPLEELLLRVVIEEKDTISKQTGVSQAS